MRRKLARTFEHVIGLASVEQHFTLDFALQQPRLKLLGIRNQEQLRLVHEYPVAEDTGPTLADF